MNRNGLCRAALKPFFVTKFKLFIDISMSNMITKIILLNNHIYFFEYNDLGDLSKALNLHFGQTYNLFEPSSFLLLIVTINLLRDKINPNRFIYE